MATRAVELHSVYRRTDDARRAPRQVVFVSDTELQAPGEAPAPSELLDVSVYGCRLALPEGREVGERVWLRLLGSPPIPATVVWSENGLAGCRFDAPVDRQLVRTLTRQLH